jgi:hypothetical protein
LLIYLSKPKKIRPKSNTIILFSGVQNGIKLILELSLNDRKISCASAKYSRISCVQNKYRSNSGNFVPTGKILVDFEEEFFEFLDFTRKNPV